MAPLQGFIILAAHSGGSRCQGPTSTEFTAEVMARQGFDALCDPQHGAAEMKDVGPLLQAISQTNTVPVMRVAWKGSKSRHKCPVSTPYRR